MVHNQFKKLDFVYLVWHKCKNNLGFFALCVIFEDCTFQKILPVTMFPDT